MFDFLWISIFVVFAFELLSHQSDKWNFIDNGMCVNGNNKSSHFFFVLSKFKVTKSSNFAIMRSHS